MAKKDWRSATLVGDMGSDSAADQYPQRNVCPDCLEEQDRAREDSMIVGGVSAYDASLGPECGLECGADYDDDV